VRGRQEVEAWSESDVERIPVAATDHKIQYSVLSTRYSVSRTF